VPNRLKKEEKGRGKKMELLAGGLYGENDEVFPVVSSWISQVMKRG
jgi:hypothetical protein